MGTFKRMFRKIFRRKRRAAKSPRNVRDRNIVGNPSPPGRDGEVEKSLMDPAFSAPLTATTNPYEQIPYGGQTIMASSSSSYKTTQSTTPPPEFPMGRYGPKPVGSLEHTKPQYPTVYSSINSTEIKYDSTPYSDYDPSETMSPPLTPATPTTMSQSTIWPVPSRPVSGRRDWRSGYKQIDDLVQGIRLEYPQPDQCLCWVPFSEFVSHRFVARGGFSSIYQATWLKTGQRIALKCLDNSGDMSQDYLDQIKCHWSLYTIPDCLRIHGITQLPENGDFMLVMQYAPYGNLRIFLQRNRMSGWKERISVIKNIARSMAEIHKRGLVHGDIHCGNILNIDGNRFVISDAGLHGPANKTVRQKKGTYGVLPYVAPEILAGHECTQESDVYSFAMIMWELSSGIQPYSGRAHDHYLAKDVYEGARPQIVPGTPTFYQELMTKCWESNPKNRPNAQEILQFVFKWLVNDRVDDVKRTNSTSSTSSSRSFNLFSERVHPDAVYHSRLLEFPDLHNRSRKPVSSTLYTKSPPVYEAVEKDNLYPIDQKSNPNSNNTNATPRARRNISSPQNRTAMSIYITDEEIDTVQAFWAASESMPTGT